jgi:hypothetical protein
MEYKRKTLASLAIAYTPVAVGSPRRQRGHAFLIPNHLAMQFWWNSCTREHGITLTAHLFPVLELLQADATAASTTAAVVSASGNKLALLEASHRRCGCGEHCTAEAAAAGAMPSFSERRYGC